MSSEVCRAGASPAGLDKQQLVWLSPNSLFSILAVYYDESSHSAAMNMAVDEALLETANVPTIRFYRWDHPALSFGYFGRFADVVNEKRDLVRRWTGGGIVFHGEDLTYSIVIPATDPVFLESSILIYEKVHCALRDALTTSGEPVELATEKALSAEPGGNICFASPVRADVLLDGRKIAGAAQRRTRRGLLQQGSIQNVNLGNGLGDRFARALSSKMDRREIDEAVFCRAREIARQKYGSEAWLWKR